MSRPSIGLVIYALNEEEHIERTILSAINYVDEFVLWDTGSIDATVEIASTYADRIHRLAVPEEAMDFGEIETMVMRLTVCDWVLRLDGDEELRVGSDVALETLVGEKGKHVVWGFPRYRWADLDRNAQLEKEAFPDVQYRLMPNDGKSRFIGAVHPRLETSHSVIPSGWAVLDHFVDPLHLNDPEKLERRNRLYARLAAKEGKAPEGSAEAMRLAGAG